jgi:DNA primase
LGGDIFSFVMQRDGVDFPTALRTLAGRAGVEISERTTREDAQRKRLRDALEAAIAFYHVVLTQHPQGEPARAYLHSRGFTDETIGTFQLGWAPDSWDALTNALIVRRRLTEADLLSAGLVNRSSRGSRNGRGVFDRFRARIMFPIRDAQGQPTGFTGRILPGAEPQTDREPRPKYMNTSATPLFDKSRTLYLIDKAKSAIRKERRVVLVEGNTDALMAHQAGFANVVCSMGTALTPGQVELLTRYAPRIALAYDVDAAGQGAATFGATELTALRWQADRSEHKGRLTDIDVVRLPDGKDPDEVIRDTPEVWRAATERPQPIMEYLIDRAAERADTRSVPGRQRVVEAVVPILRGISDPVWRAEYVQLLSKRSGVGEGEIQKALDRPAGRQGGDHAGTRISLDAVLASPGALDPRAVDRSLDPTEKALLRLLLERPALVPITDARLTADSLTTTPARELYRALVAAPQPFDRGAFLAGLEPTLEAIARTLYATSDPLPDTEDDIRQALDQIVLTLEQARLAELLDYKRAELADAESAGDDATRDRVQQDVLELQRRRLALDLERRDASLLANRRRPTPTHETAPGGHP